MAKRTHIVFETEETVRILAPGTAKPVWCAACARQVRMLTAEQARALVGVSLRAILRWLEAGECHFLETDNGTRLLICADSLLKFIDRPDQDIGSDPW
jgi:hypothetical protein